MSLARGTEKLSLCIKTGKNNEKTMKYVICIEGYTRPVNSTVILTMDDAILVFKGVFIETCKNCGEYYLDDSTTEALMLRAEKEVENGLEMDILRLAA